MLDSPLQRRRTGDYSQPKIASETFPVAAARALGHDQEQRSDEHTVAVSAVSGSRRPAVAHLSAGSAPSDSGIFRLV